jgi:hypothetical protein
MGEIHRLRPKGVAINLQMSQVKGWGYSGQKGLDSKRSNKAGKKYSPIAHKSG